MGRDGHSLLRNEKSETVTSLFTQRYLNVIELINSKDLLLL